MKKCVRCNKYMGVNEINGKLYCNGCYQMFAEEIREGVTTINGLEDENRGQEIVKINVEPTWELAWGLYWKFFIFTLIPGAVLTVIVLIILSIIGF